MYAKGECEHPDGRPDPYAKAVVRKRSDSGSKGGIMLALLRVRMA